MNIKKIYQHMRKNGGYVGALRIARAAAMAEDIGLSVTWEMEEGDWMDYAGDPEELYREKFASQEWECFHAFVKDEAGETLASLDGIILSRSSGAYKLCCEYELLAEAWEEILKVA